tara:strand:- start:6193 stop:7578 length:1386 start_codon:yes stop_codon:yes gene_type:complete
MYKKVNLKNLPDSYNDSNVCVMGLGYVGLTLAVTLADIGFNVIGIEINKEILKKISNGKAHFFEPGLEGRLQSVIRSRNLKVFNNIPKKCKSSIFIITVGTPIDQKDKVRRSMIENVSKEISENLKKNDLIILRSTVEVGTTEYLKNKFFDKRKVDYQIAFCPERTIEGKAMIELRQLPQIIGADDINVASRVSQFFSFMTPTVVRVSSKETAELIKLVDNCQRDVNFALSNEIAEISDSYSISAFEVISSGKLGYPRTNLPIPGPVGGPCLEKDSYILKNGLQKKKYFPQIIMSSRDLNKNQPKKTISLLSKFTDIFLKKRKINITLAGIAFKGNPETNDLRGTMSKPIFEEIKKKFNDSKISFYDPLVNKKEILEYFHLKNIEFTENIEKSFFKCDLYIICNNHPLFHSIPINNFSLKMKKPGIIFDFWNNFTNQKITFPDGIYYLGLGSIGKSIRKFS